MTERMINKMLFAIKNEQGVSVVRALSSSEAVRLWVEYTGGSDGAVEITFLSDHGPSEMLVSPLPKPPESVSKPEHRPEPLTAEGVMPWKNK